MGEMEILLIREEGKRVGFAITAIGDHLVLLDYFAIDDRFRGHGYGSRALELLREIYSDSQFFLEIEMPDETQPGNDLRLRRKAFYLRNHMLETGIKAEMFGVRMELLASKPGLKFEACEQIYRSLLGALYPTAVKRITG